MQVPRTDAGSNRSSARRKVWGLLTFSCTRYRQNATLELSNDAFHSPRDNRVPTPAPHVDARSRPRAENHINLTYAAPPPPSPRHSRTSSMGHGSIPRLGFPSWMTRTCGWLDWLESTASSYQLIRGNAMKHIGVSAMSRRPKLLVRVREVMSIKMQ